MKSRTFFIAWTFALFVFASVAHAIFHNTVIEDASALYEFACKETKRGDSQWHISNLYDCKAKRLFIPYQLWTGADWDGDKDAPCMHKADTLFHVNARSATTIKGPKEWDGWQVWDRSKVKGSKTQYFVCHNKGIGRVFEVRRGRERQFKPGRCKFPAGYGWEPGKRGECVDTALKIYQIEFGGDHNLSALEFEYWFKTRSRGLVLNHKYRYVPNVGMTDAWPQ